MGDTPFKTPRSFKSKNPKPRPTPSDTDDSTTSSASDTGESARHHRHHHGEISLVAEYDDFIRFARQLAGDDEHTYEIFLNFLIDTKELYEQWSLTVLDNKRMQNDIDVKSRECSDLESKLSLARKLLDQERRNTRVALKERDDLSQQIEYVRDWLLKKNNGTVIPEETREKLSFLENDWDANMNGPQLSAIKEVNSTGSILSDFSYSRSEDDLDASLSHVSKTWKKHRPSGGGVPEPANKKRRSSSNHVVEINTTDTVRATTTLFVPKDGPIKATSVIESIANTPHTETAPTQANVDPLPNNGSAVPANLVLQSWARNSPTKPPRHLNNNNNARPHTLESHNMIFPEICNVCEKRIRFSRAYVKCKDCRALCHVECKERLPLPCVPYVNTPNQRTFLGVIGDYTPTIPPMVPAILIHCINEIELRGLNEVGIYRVSASERDVKALKEKFMRNRGGIPCLNQIDVHVLCGTVKDFLRSLREPLITSALWIEFVRAMNGTKTKSSETEQKLYQAIAKLPQPNRDTLAYLMVHLQKVSESIDCKMTVYNLAMVLGPTVVGYSSDVLSQNELLMETTKLVTIMENLLELPRDYWLDFINVNTLRQPYGRLQQTPSTDSLLRPNGTSRSAFITPTKRKRRNFFATPPN